MIFVKITHIFIVSCASSGNRLVFIRWQTSSSPLINFSISMVTWKNRFIFRWPFLSVSAILFIAHSKTLPRPNIYRGASMSSIVACIFLAHFIKQWNTKQWIQQIINPPNYPWYIGLILHHYFGTAEYTKHWHLINLYALQIINYIEIYAKSSEIFNRCKWYPIGFVYFGYFQNTVLPVFIPSKLASYMMMAIYQEISWKSRCSSFDFLRPLYTATANDKKNYR